MQKQKWCQKVVQVVCSACRVVRLGLGWLSIGIGILGLVLPVLHGTFFLAIGIALVGRRHPTIRWWSVQIKLFLRKWARHKNPLLGRVGRQVLGVQQNFSRHRRRISWWFAEQRAKKRGALSKSVEKRWKWLRLIMEWCK